MVMGLKYIGFKLYMIEVKVADHVIEKIKVVKLFPQINNEEALQWLLQMNNAEKIQSDLID